MQHPKIRLNRKQAKALIAYYGTEKTFSRILHEADHLKKMSVFSSDDYENITTLAKEMVELSELHSTLVAHGLELGIIEQLKKIKLSSHRIRHLIQTQTYALIGMLFLPFQQADRIFKIFNPEPEPALAQYRAVFLVTYHLNQLCNKQGDTYISYNALWKAVVKSSDQLGINAFDQAVTAAENKKLIKSVLDINNKRLLFPFYLYQSEQKIMSFLTQKIPV